MTSRHEDGRTSETAEQKARAELFEAFMHADQQRNKLLREAMQKALDAPEGALTSVERTVLALTGDFEVLTEQRELAERVKKAIGQPILAVNGVSRYVDIYLGIISGELDGKVQSTTHGQLLVPLARTVEWKNTHRSPHINQNVQLPLRTIHYCDSEPIMGLAVAQTDPVEHSINEGFQTLLIGYDEVLGCEDVGKYSEYFKLLMSDDDGTLNS